jgi:two-component system cell cycle sensor histidine kinase/response regulator CckA
VTQPEKNTLETILVVEDHDAVLQVVCEILGRSGFRVLRAASGAEAIQTESITQETIHLLLSDVMMPDMSGPVCAQLLQKRRPEMRVMMMSGYPGGDMLFLNHGWHYIEKPFVPYQLVARVNDALHSLEPSQGTSHFDTRVKPKESAPAARNLTP